MALPNTQLGTPGVTALLDSRKRVWFIGIGGIQMAALAIALRARGFFVAGSDSCESTQVSLLRREGITVYIGHKATHLTEFDAAVYTLAVSADNPEYSAALHLGIPIISRAELLAFLCATYPCRIGVAGSHGKSTVTAMLAAIHSEAGRDPTVFCGAPLAPDAPSFLLGKGRDCIFEACEYQDSFLRFSPTVSVVLNTDHDHADYFASRDDLCRSLSRYAALPGDNGLFLYNAEDASCRQIAATCGVPALSFGIRTGDMQADDLRYREGRGEFSLLFQGAPLGHLSLAVIGEHNVKNALAAALCAHVSGVAPEAICRGLSRFSGAARRLEYRGLWCGARLFDDYAHHPAEISATLAALRKITCKTDRIFAVFQPHTYSRTRAFFGEFGEALRAADRVFITDIYPARETDTLGMSAQLLAERVGEHACHPDSTETLLALLRAELGAGDILVVMGAGDINGIFCKIWKKGFTL